MPETNGAGQGEAGPSPAQIRADAGAASKSPANSVTNGATEANGTAKRAAVRKDGQSGNGKGPLSSGSSSSPLHVAPAPMQHEPANGNGSGSKRRRVHDSSPAATSSEASTSRHQSRQPRVRAVHTAGRNDALLSDPLPSGAVMGSMSDRLGSTPPLDAAEREQFAFRATASPSSRILLQAPPSLPYDLSYPPLSPLGTDQAGHSIALRYGHVGLPGSKDARNGAGAGPSSRGLLPGQPGNSHERPKKVLRGEEHERHMVSEAAGPDAMPWGLKTTLIEKSRQLPRGKTRMGTQKRNAPRSVRAAQGPDDRTQTPQPIKIEEDFASEFSSPMLANMELEARVDDAKEVSPPLQESSLNIVEEANVDGTLDDSKGSGTMDVDESRAAVMTPRRNGNGHQASLSPSGPSTRRQQRRDADAGDSLDPQAAAGTRSPSGTSVAAQHADDSVDMDESQVGDLSTDQSQSGPSRRPRAAHKRLTLLGGYYGRGKKQAANGGEGSSPRVSPAPSSLPDKAESTRDESRAVSEASLAEEGTSVLVAVPEEAQMTSGVVAGPSTPVKASQQPSLSLGLRESATKRSSTKLHHAGTRNDDEEDDNNSYCETCHGTGHFICCDGCPRSFHFACINPPLDIDELPSTFDDEDDQWFCNVCRVSKRPRGKKPKGVWGPLLQRVEDENPTIFSLPQDVRNYFKGVATATDGSYVDSSMLKPVKVNKNGIVDGREDPLRLKDKNGKLVLCYRCGQSALPPSQDTGRDRENLARKDAKELSEMDRTGWRKLIGCDFCSLHWHLDCLDPPLATMPSSTRKWMCPNHIEHVMRPERVPKNAANSQSVHDLPLPSDKSVGRGKHYRTRVLNDGRIDIIPDPMDTYFGGSSSLAGQDGNGHVAPLTSIAGSSGSENRGRGLDRGWEEIDIPGAQARAGSGSAASASLAANASHIRFKYRLPEKVIRVDFWSRAELERKLALDEVARLAQERNRAPLDLLATIANAETLSKKTVETLRKDKEAKMQLSAQRARELVAQAFGSGARFARPGRPVEAGNADDMQVIAPDIEAVAISALRETYEEGEFEREFFQTEPLPPVRMPPKRKAPREADMAGLDTSADTVLGTNGQSSAEGAAVKAEEPSTAAANDSDKAKDNMLETALDVDADELAQLRALRQLVQYRGADALLDFVLK